MVTVTGWHYQTEHTLPTEICRPDSLNLTALLAVLERTSSWRPDVTQADNHQVQHVQSTLEAWLQTPRLDADTRHKIQGTIEWLGRRDWFIITPVSLVQ